MNWDYHLDEPFNPYNEPEPEDDDDLGECCQCSDRAEALLHGLGYCEKHFSALEEIVMGAETDVAYDESKENES
jgi:hypothetical protein